MKPVLILSLILLGSTPAYADADACTVISSLAEHIMHARQVGVPARVVTDLVSSREESLRNLTMALVKEAYSEPLWGTDQAKTNAETEFSNQVYLRCLK